MINSGLDVTEDGTSLVSLGEIYEEFGERI